MMTIEIKSVKHENGRRVEEVVKTYGIEDDLIEIGNLYRALGERLTQQKQPGGDSIKLSNEISACRMLIAKQQEYIDGYKDSGSGDAK